MLSYLVNGEFALIEVVMAKKLCEYHLGQNLGGGVFTENIWLQTSILQGCRPNIACIMMVRN